MADISNYEYIKTLSKEEMTEFIRKIQINADNNLPTEWKENKELHCKLLIKWLESWGFGG